MPHPPSLSVADAARLIYRTARPDASQLLSVRSMLRSGHLHGAAPAGLHKQWTTTPQAVAELLARSQVDRSLASVQQHGNGARRGAEDRQLSGLYRQLLADYFLAVLLRRRPRQRSAVFQWTVVAGQAAALLLALALLAWSLAQMRGGGAVLPPERLVVEQWLEQHSSHHEVIRWHPPRPADEGAGILVRVEYRYRQGAAGSKQTDRTLLIDQGRVIRVDTTE